MTTMSNSIYILARDVGDRETQAAQLWDACVHLSVAWVSAVRTGDAEGAVRAEAELRFFALFYAAQASDTAGVSTGRKAVLRSLYADHGGPDTVLVRAMIDAAITRETAAAGR